MFSCRLRPLGTPPSVGHACGLRGGPPARFEAGSPPSPNTSHAVSPGKFARTNTIDTEDCVPSCLRLLTATRPVSLVRGFGLWMTCRLRPLGTPPSVGSACGLRGGPPARFEVGSPPSPNTSHAVSPGKFARTNTIDTEDCVPSCLRLLMVARPNYWFGAQQTSRGGFWMCRFGRCLRLEWFK